MFSEKIAGRFITNLQTNFFQDFQGSIMNSFDLFLRK